MKENTRSDKCMRSGFIETIVPLQIYRGVIAEVPVLKLAQQSG
jgi:hypothetical protein